MDYQFSPWERTKTYRCQPCGKPVGNTAMKMTVDFDTNWICFGCGNLVEIKMTHERSKDRWAQCVIAEHLKIDDELAFEIEGSTFAYVTGSNEARGKSNEWWIARQGHRGENVDRRKTYYRFTD